MALNYYTYKDTKVAIVTLSTLNACFYKYRRGKEEPPILAELQDLRVIPLSRVLEYRMDTLALPCYTHGLTGETGRGERIVIGTITSSQDHTKSESQILLESHYELEKFRRDYCVFANEKRGYDWTSKAYRVFMELDDELMYCEYKDEFDYTCNVYNSSWEDDMAVYVSELDLSICNEQIPIPVPLTFGRLLDQTRRERNEYRERPARPYFIYD